MTTYAVIFNSGSTNEFRYDNQGNVDYFNITNSDQTYYQTAAVGLHDIGDDDVDVNNTLLVLVDDKIQFDGYVNRVKKSLLGTDVYNVEAIGRTYDLWRSVTSSNTEFREKYTAYIVSSLVRMYCTGASYNVETPYIGPTSGAYIDYVSFPDMEIGNCVGRMAQMDGYSFYVSSNGRLMYYNPVDTPQFTIEESDILDMSPYDLSDDSMRNKVLVLGSREYELNTYTPSTTSGYYFISGPTSHGATGDARYYAQGIIVPDSLHNNWLSSIQLYLSRSSGANIPYYLKGELRKDDSGVPQSSFMSSSDSMYFAGSNLLNPPNWTDVYTYNIPESFPITAGEKIWLTFHYDGASPDRYWKLYYQTFDTTQYGLPNNTIDEDPVFTGTWDYDGQGYGKVGYSAEGELISFAASSIGYSAKDVFDNNYSRVHTEFGISGGGVYDDLISFTVSTNIKVYMSGSESGSSYSQSQYDYGTKYNKWDARLMIGVFDPTAPGGNDYNPMMGFEFSMAGNYTNSEIIETFDEVGSLALYGHIDCYDMWYGQTFTIGTTSEDYEYVLDKIKLPMSQFWSGDYTKVWAYVTAVDGANKPTGDPICSGANITSDAQGPVLEFPLHPKKRISKSTQYAFYLLAFADNTIEINIWADFANSYAGGQMWESDDDGSSWDASFPNELFFELYAFRFKSVRPFLSKDITSAKVPIDYRHGDWTTTGAKSYKCELNGSNFLFYIDDTLKQTWNISDVTLDGGYRFGTGYKYNWSAIRIQMIDPGYSTAGTTADLCSISGNIKYIKVAGSPDDSMATSTDSGQTWTAITDRHMIYDIGWNYDNVRGTSEDSESMGIYGTHFYKVSEPLINTYTDADNYATRLVDKYKNGIAKGDIEITGRTDINILSKFNLDITHLDLDEDMVISTYTQALDKNGFTTKISYGEAPYDIARKVANLESSVYE